MHMETVRCKQGNTAMVGVAMAGELYALRVGGGGLGHPGEQGGPCPLIGSTVAQQHPSILCSGERSLPKVAGSCPGLFAY